MTEAVQSLPSPFISDLVNGDPIRALPSPASKYTKYPLPLATFEDVVGDAKLFWETLEKLHSALGTKFMVPTVGGKELNLHKLFTEVTSRGGIEKVIHDRRWKEITSSFSFPSTATNASFVLRKYYLSLLSHYEQLYFFKSEGWNAPISGLSTSVLTPVQVNTSPESPLPPRDTQIMAQKKKSISELSKPGVNSPVVGIIDGKFDGGYLVSVRVGADTLRGVVYLANGNSVAQASLAIDSIQNPVRVGRRKRRRKRSKWDPTHPKPNRSGYNFFFAEQHAKLKLIHPGKDREISKMIGERWNKLSDSEKAVYQEFGAKDRERYHREMVVYRERFKTGGHLIISNAVPIQQIPAGMSVPIASDNHEMEEDNRPSSPSIDSGGSTESDLYMVESNEVQIGTDPPSIMDKPVDRTHDTQMLAEEDVAKDMEPSGAALSDSSEATKDELSKNEQ